MAGQVPSFITGANAKIKAGGITFAYAQDVGYRVSVDVIPVETMGRYEVVSHEPVNYSVAGELAVVRYTKYAQENGMPGAAEGGNGMGNVNWKIGGGKASDHINPGNLLMSKTWDLEVFQKIQDDQGKIETVGGNEGAFIKISDCRFTSRGAGLNKRGILVDRYSFVGILASDDSFTATGSGDTDLS